MQDSDMSNIYNVVLPLVSIKYHSHDETKNLFMKNLDDNSKILELINFNIKPNLNLIFDSFAKDNFFENEIINVNALAPLQDSIPFRRKTRCTWVGYYILDIKFNGLDFIFKNVWKDKHTFKPIVREGDIIFFPSIMEHQISMLEKDQTIIEFEIA